jgi:hypothetical protein
MPKNFVVQSVVAAAAPPPPRGRGEALAAVGHYTRLAAFAATCAVWVLVRYVILGRWTRRAASGRT